MKTYKHLYPQVVALENLQRAYVQASKGKRRYGYVDRFAFGLERELFQLQRELQEKTYRPGPYHNFYITEPKHRLVSAAPFRDRVVHHALCNAIEPIYEWMFIYGSYACRVGKGQHRAADRYTEFCRKNRYVFKCDVEKFFPSVDHAILLDILRRRLKDKDLMGLVETILWSGRDVLKEEYVMRWFPGDDLLTPLSRDRGLPIGNLTSQFFANVYLNELDHFVKAQQPTN